MVDLAIGISKLPGVDFLWVSGSPEDRLFFGRPERCERDHNFDPGTLRSQTKRPPKKKIGDELFVVRFFPKKTGLTQQVSLK